MDYLAGPYPKATLHLRANRWHCLVFLALLPVLLVTSLATAHAAADPGQDQRILKSGSELDYPPFAVVSSDGSADGFSVELLQAVTRVVGLEIDFVVGPWNVIKQQLIDGRLDVLPLVSYSPERDEVLDFSAPYLRMRGTIFVRQGDNSIHDDGDLKGKELLVMRDDAAHEYAAKRQLSDKLILTDSFEEAMTQLSAGKHDAVIVQQLVGLQLIKKLKLTNLVSVRNLVQTDLKPVSRPLADFEQKFCFAVPEGQKELLAELNEGLAIVITSGEYEELYQKWFGPILPHPPVNAGMVAKYLLLVLVPTGLLAALTGVWYLRRKVRQKTAYLQEEIKDRLRAEEALVESVTFNRAVLDNLPIGVSVNTVETKVDFSYMNDNFPRIYRTSREALAKSDAFWEEVYPDPQFRARIRQRVMADCASNDPERMVWEDIPIIRKDQETSYISARNIVVPGRQLMISTVWDVTERKRTEEKLARLNVDLRAKNTELEQVVYVASHDLRSPLVNIDGYSRELGYAIGDIRQALADRPAIAEQLPAVVALVSREIPEALRFIQASASKMDMLLNGLLRLSRLGRAALTFTSLDMNTLISEVVDSMEFQIREAGVVLDIGKLPRCRGDKVQVNQIFSNLLDNALKYRDHQRPGRISVTGRLADDRALYCVEDNGIGIEPAHQQKIFEIFHRLNSVDCEGEGLGLTIVKRIVSRLEGDIWVESASGSGCRFHIALPQERNE